MSGSLSWSCSASFMCVVEKERCWRGFVLFFLIHTSPHLKPKIQKSVQLKKIGCVFFSSHRNGCERWMEGVLRLPICNSVPCMVPGGVVGWIVLGWPMCNQLVQKGNCLIVRIPKYKNCSVQNIFRTDGKTPDVWTVYCISVWDRARTGLGRETRETTTGCLPNLSGKQIDPQWRFGGLIPGFSNWVKRKMTTNYLSLTTLLNTCLYVVHD